ncbi:unnamed protein product [Polarella glacialis]|uniref:Anoctamin transmembrane domain-containing protein n=1 Tax=Polarella glacialis TaxID=89957 RepID=A0A813GL72_POLGL|nr:unnamed protein product [Polarella glacialis]
MPNLNHKPAPKSAGLCSCGGGPDESATDLLEEKLMSEDFTKILRRMFMVMGPMPQEDPEPDSGMEEDGQPAELSRSQTGKIMAMGQEAEELLGTFEDGMTRSEFILKARGIVQQMIEKSGLKIEKFVSIDGDMEFWKVAFESDTQWARALAVKFGYSLPFSKKAYQRLGKNMPMLNGRRMPAHHEFQDHPDLIEDLEPFRTVDLIRLIMQQLLSDFNLEEMQKEGVITKWFPGAKCEGDHSMKSVYHHFWNIMPSPSEYEAIRNYFGEEVGFFFRFYGYFLHALSLLVIPAFCVCLAQSDYLLVITYQQQNYLKMLFGLMVAIWAIHFQRFFEFKANDECHRWGMANNKSQHVHELKLSQVQQRQSSWLEQNIGNAAMLVYTLGFVYAISIVSFHTKDRYSRSIASTATTFVFSFFWGMIAPKVVKLEDHATSTRETNALTKRLAFVKLFLFLFPLCNVAFLSNATRKVCADTYEKAAEMIFDPNAFEHYDPSEIGPNTTVFRNWVDRNLMGQSDGWGTALDIMNVLGMATPLPEGQVCVRGCMPQLCDPISASDRRPSCLTDCYFELQTSLQTLFLSHLACTIAFMVIGMLFVQYKARKEMSEKETRKTTRSLSAMDSAHLQRHDYSFLQFQEKSFDEAPYEYLSWGGSYVEDFLEVVLAFAVLACFGIICPYLAIAGFLIQVIENRVLLFRMIHVTCRPFPTAADGIGGWGMIIEIVVNVALLINGLLIVTQMRTHMDVWGSKCKFVFFACWALSLLFFKMFLQALLPDISPSFIEALDKNTLFLAAQREDRANKLLQASV